MPAPIAGTILRLVTDKGFGFIRRDDGGGEFFFHKSAVEGGDFAGLREGQPVTFDEDRASVKGPRAARVVVD